MKGKVCLVTGKWETGKATAIALAQRRHGHTYLP
jgi:hypothetical protein